MNSTRIDVSRKRMQLSPLQLAILLYHVHKGAGMPEVGFEDANNTIDSLTRKLNWKSVWVYQSDVESCLWSANLMKERGEYWHPTGIEFERFAKDVMGEGFTWNNFYNLAEEK